MPVRVNGVTTTPKAIAAEVAEMVIINTLKECGEEGKQASDGSAEGAGG